jgi:hypothetical protein
LFHNFRISKCRIHSLGISMLHVELCLSPDVLMA